MTQSQLESITGRTLPDHLADALTHVMARYDVDTSMRREHFLAQLLHESGAFRWNRELWGPTGQQKKYDPPFALAARLGNTAPGDGFRYRGRGFIQLTGKNNYREYSEHLGLDLVTFPDLVAELPLAVDVAGWFWTKRNINRWADADDVVGVTRRINGGTNGLADRKRWLAKVRGMGG